DQLGGRWGEYRSHRDSSHWSWYRGWGAVWATPRSVVNGGSLPAWDACRASPTIITPSPVVVEALPMSQDARVRQPCRCTAFALQCSAHERPTDLPLATRGGTGADATGPGTTGVPVAAGPGSDRSLSRHTSRGGCGGRSPAAAYCCVR